MWVINPQRLMSQKYKQVASAHGSVKAECLSSGVGWMCFTQTKTETVLEKASPLSEITLPESANEWD